MAKKSRWGESHSSESNPSQESLKRFNSAFLETINKTEEGHYVDLLKIALKNYSRTQNLGSALETIFRGGVSDSEEEQKSFLEGVFEKAPQAILNSFNGQTNIGIGDQNTLANFMILSLLEQYLNQSLEVTNKDGEKTKFTLYSKSKELDITKNALGINLLIFTKPFFNKFKGFQSLLFKQCLFVNKYVLPEHDSKSHPSLQDKALSLLRDGVLIKNFDIIQDFAFELSNEEKLLKIIRMQSDVIGKGFSSIENWYPKGKPLPRGFRSQAEEIQKKLIESRDLQNAQARVQEEKKRHEDRFLEIQKQLGKNSLAKPRSFLEKVAALSKKELEDIQKSSNPVSNLLYRELEGYRKAAFKLEISQQALEENRENLKGLRDQFVKSNNEVIQTLNLENVNPIEIKTLFAYFSMVFFNEGLNLDLKNLGTPETKLLNTKLKGVKERVSNAFQKLKNYKREPIDENENKNFETALAYQFEKMLVEYSPQEKVFKKRVLQDDDIRLIGEAAKQISEKASNGDRSAIEQFQRLKKILKKSLVEDDAFSAALSEWKNFSAKRVHALSAHFEAAKIFINAGSPEQFAEVTQAVLDSVSGSNILKKIEKSGQGLVKAASKIALQENPQIEAFQSSLQKIVSSDVLQRSNDVSLQVVARENSALKKEIDDLKTRYKRDAEKITKRLFRDGLFSYVGFKDIVRGNFPKDGNEIVTYRTARETPGFYSNELGYIPGDLEYTHHNLYRELEDGKGSALVKRGDFYNSFKRFWDNYMEVNYPIESERLFNKYEGYTNNKIKNSASILDPVFDLEVLERKIKTLEKKLQVYELKKRNGIDPNGIDLLANKSLFEFYQKKYVDVEKNQKISNDIYQEFLPVFVGSFTQVDANFGTERLRKQKAELLKDLPGSKRVFNAMEEWRQNNLAQITNFNRWVQEELQKNRQNNFSQEESIQQIMQEAPGKISEFFGNMAQTMSNTMVEGMLSSEVLSGSIVSSGIFLGMSRVFAFSGAISSLSTVGSLTVFSLACTGALYNASQFAKRIFSSALENVQAFFGAADYREDAPIEMLSSMLLNALKNEVNAFSRFKSLNDKMNYSFYLQEFFDSMRQMRTDFTTYSERMNSLAPNVASQSNFSAMIGDLFCRYIRDVFLVVPNEILQRANSPHFPAAIEEFLSEYKEVLSSVASTYQGGNSQEFNLGIDNNFSDFMKAQRVDLKFSADSEVGALFENQSRTFRFEGDQIIPYENINPGKMGQYVERFLGQIDLFQDLEEKFKDQLRTLLRQTASAESFSAPLQEDQLNFATQGLRSSSEMLRFGFDLARGMRQIELGGSNDYERQLFPSGESARSILSSKLMRESISILKKTATFSDLLNLESGRKSLRALNSIEFQIDDFLKGMALNPPSYQTWKMLEDGVEEMIIDFSSRYPSISYPILLEFAENKGLLLPQVIWMFQKEELQKQNIAPIQNSPTLYLTNESLGALSLENRKTRSFLLSPFLVNAFEENVIKKFSNPELLRFLGRVSETSQRMQNSIQSVPRSLPQIGTSALSGVRNIFGRPQQQSAQPQLNQGNASAFPTLRLEPKDGYIQPSRPSSMVNEESGMAPYQYDPQNIGLTAPQAEAFYNPQQQLQQQQNPQIEEVPESVPAQIFSSQSPQQNAQQTIQNPPQQQNPMQRQQQMQNAQQQQMQNQMQQDLMGTMMSQQASNFYQQQAQQQQQQQQAQQQQMQNAQNSARNQVGVSAQGGTFGFLQEGAPNTPPPQRFAAEAAPPPMELAASQQPPPRSFPPPSLNPYSNMSRNTFQPIQPPVTAASGYGKPLALLGIGSGLAIGAGLLGSSLKKKKKEK